MKKKKKRKKEEKTEKGKEKKCLTLKKELNIMKRLKDIEKKKEKEKQSIAPLIDQSKKTSKMMSYPVALDGYTRSVLYS